MVVSGDARFFEAYRLLWAKFSEGDADLHAELGNVLDDVDDLLKTLRAAAHAAPRRAHAEAGGTGFRGDLGALHDVAFCHQALGFHAGFVAGGLGAVRAILGAAAGLDREQGAELDFRIGPVFLMHRAGLLDEFEKREGMQVLEFGEGHGVNAGKLKC